MKEYLTPYPSDLTYQAILTAISEGKLRPPTDSEAFKLFQLKLRELVEHGYVKGRVGHGTSSVHLTPEGREELLRRLNRQAEKKVMADKKIQATIKFLPGDLVRLRSGGLPMTVNYIWDNGPHFDVECVWFASDIMQRRRINQDALDPIA